MMFFGKAIERRRIERQERMDAIEVQRQHKKEKAEEKKQLEEEGRKREPWKYDEVFEKACRELVSTHYNWHSEDYPAGIILIIEPVNEIIVLQARRDSAPRSFEEFIDSFAWHRVNIGRIYKNTSRLDENEIRQELNAFGIDKIEDMPRAYHYKLITRSGGNTLEVLWYEDRSD